MLLRKFALDYRDHVRSFQSESAHYTLSCHDMLCILDFRFCTHWFHNHNIVYHTTLARFPPYYYYRPTN